MKKTRSQSSNMTTLCSSRPSKAAHHRAALYHAVVVEEKQKILEIVRHGMDWSLRDDNGDTVLHLAFDRADNTPRQIIEILKIFLDLGLDVNIKNIIGKTALHLAVRDRSKEIVEFLMERGGDLNIRDERGNSIAHYLVETEFKRFRECVFAYGSPDDRNLLERESVEFIYWLMSSKGLDVECANKVGLTALQLALIRNLQHVLPIFFKFARHVNFVDDAKGTILHIFLEKNALYKDYAKQHETKKLAIPSFFYGTEYGINIVQILLDKDVSVDAVDDNGNTPLHIAGRAEEPDIPQLMLEKFTNVNARNERGETALHVVIAGCKDYIGLHFDEYVEAARALIAKGAGIHLRNNDGYAAVQLAAMRKHLGFLNVLKEHKADFRVLSSQGENLLHLVSCNMKEMVNDRTYDKMVDLLVSEGCDVNAKDKDDVSPLHLAAKFGSLAVVKKLIQHGARLDCREKSRLLTPLHLAADFDHLSVIEELIRAGGDVNAKDVWGITSLHRAARHFTGETVKSLLKLGGHVDAQDRHGRLPLDMAIEYDNPAAVEELLKYGADINDPNALSAVVLLNNNYMYHILLDHWYKLKAVGLPCANEYMYYNEDDFKCSRDGCVEEVEELKNCMIDDRTSLYDLLHMNLNQKCFYVKTNTELKLLVESSALELQFPRYHGLILASYRDGLARKKMLEPAKQAWYELTRINLPNICLELILDNLSNANLRRMVEGDDIRRLKRSFARKAGKAAKRRRAE